MRVHELTDNNFVRARGPGESLREGTYFLPGRQLGELSAHEQFARTKVEYLMPPLLARVRVLKIEIE